MERVLIIVNPKSGVDKNKNQITESAVKLCEDRGLALDIEFTSGPGDARRLAEEAAKAGVDMVIAAGGDGTVRDVADGLWLSGTAMGIVPIGSGNGLARSLCIPQDSQLALKTALSGNTIVIDRGVANGNSFYSAFGVGFDAEVSYQFSQDKRRGRTTYIKHAIHQMFTFRPRRFKIRSGDNIIETEALLIAVCNCKQYGNNAYIAPQADPADGHLDMTVVHSGNFFAKMVAGIELFSGTLDKNILVENLRTKEIEIIDDAQEGKTIAHVDGEPLESASRVRITCERGGLRISVPKVVQPFKPIITPVKSMLDDFILDIKKNLQQN